MTRKTLNLIHYHKIFPAARGKTPEDVRVPGKEDDELTFDVLIHDVIGQLPEGWRCVEGEIEKEDVFYMAVGKGEVNQKQLSLMEREHFVEAKRNELEQHSINDVWEFSLAPDVQKAEAAGRVITARWVWTWRQLIQKRMRRKDGKQSQGWF